MNYNNYYNQQQQQQQQQPQTQYYQIQQPQPQLQESITPLINFIHNSGVEIYCDAPSFSDEYNINNLITPNNNNGFLASSFLKPPIDITVSLPYPIDLERIGVFSKVGTCVSQSISFYISEYSMNELQQKAASTIQPTISSSSSSSLSQSHGSIYTPQPSFLSTSNTTTTTTNTTTNTIIPPHSSHLGVYSNTDLSIERYPGTNMKSSYPHNIINSSNSNSSNQGTTINIGGSISGFNFGSSTNQHNINNLNVYTSMSSSQPSSSSSSSASPYSTSPSTTTTTKSILSQSLPMITNNNSSTQNSNLKQQLQKSIHEQFKFVGSFNDLHLQESFYKYICINNQQQQQQQLLNQLPKEIQMKIKDPDNQIKYFHSNKHLLCRVKSVRIRILKVLNSSCAALGGLELWGKPSQSCSIETIQYIYNNNLNNIQKLNYNSNNNNSSNINYFTTYPQNLQQSKQQQQQQPNQIFKPSLPSLPIQNQNTPQSQQFIVDLDESMMSSDGEVDSADEDFKRNNPEIIFNEAGIPTTFLDPITLEMMNDPVILPSGVVVDRSTIEKHFQNHYFTDPYSGERISPQDIQTNHVLWSKIQQYKDRGKRKRILKSNSSIFKNQLQLNMLPQINSNILLNSNNNGLGNTIYNPIKIDGDDDEPMEINNRNNNNNNNSGSSRPGLSKIVSQDSFVELPIKKHRK